MNIVKQPENLKKNLINLGVLAVVFVISFVLANDGAVLDVSGNVLEGGEAGSQSKWISTIINLSTYLGLIAIGTVAYGAVKTALKVK